MRYKCHIAYDGSAYSGWQRQPRVHTVQGAIEDALKAIYLEKVTIHGASRTDKGVHAIDQVFHYDTEKEIPLEKLIKVINRQLTDDIQLVNIEEVEGDFHSRYCCKGKEYQYRIETSKEVNVFQWRYVYAYRKTPNVELMRQAALKFIGTHDFKAFMASGSDKEETRRTIYHIDFHYEDTQLVMKVRGNGFLYNMVRIMVGVFLDISEGKYSEDMAFERFCVGDRKFFKRTAPAQGLYLTKTFYSLEDSN